jgi:serine/threonine protein kinase/tetratricopeptide (TPR) repeat protein
MTERELFEAALELPPEGRAAYLDSVCGDDAALRLRLEGLLRRHDEARSFLESPPPELAQTANGPAIEEVGTQVGSYKLLEQIGEGGFGIVFMADQQAPVRRRVALKIIKPGMDTRQVLARFEVERQALALMDHPNIARALDAGVTDSGRPYFVMELVRGVSITSYCDETNSAVHERLELFMQVCRAVQHAHQKGIIHRDLKPSNILVTLVDGRPVPKVIDFGIAKAINQPLTQETLFTRFAEMIGTPLYMSPEQAEMTQLDIDTRSDIYSLGVLLYELLTGSTPFDKNRLKKAAYDEIRRIIREEEPPKPSLRISTLGEKRTVVAAHRHADPNRLSQLLRGDLDWIVMKALEKDRSRRYETANGLARDVERYLNDEPVEAGPPSTTYRLRKFVQRNRGQVLAAALILCALLAGIAGTTIGLIRAERQRQFAEEQRAKAEQARDLTRQALDAMTSTVTGDALSTQKEIIADQKKFLTEVLTYYQQFAGEKADDQQSQARTAAAARRVGEIERGLGRYEQAVAALKIARDGYAILVSDFPAAPDYRDDLARSHNHLGLALYDFGKRSEAEGEYRQAITIQETLAAEFPNVPLYQEYLAAYHNNLGRVLRDLGKPSEGTEPLRRAIAIQQKLADENAGVPRDRSKLAIYHNNLGILQARLGKELEAEREYREAIVIGEKLAADFPPMPEYQDELADAHHSRGILGKNRSQSQKDFRTAQAIWEKLVADFPTAPKYRLRLAKCHNNFWILLREMGKPSEADEHIRKGLAILDKLVAEFPEVPEYRQQQSTSRIFLAVTRINAGQVTEGIAEVAELASSEWDPITWYNFACVYAIASGKSPQKKQEYADRAMELLNKAVTAGYRNAANMKRDTDLALLHDREDFKKLLGKLAAGNEAAKKP